MIRCGIRRCRRRRSRSRLRCRGCRRRRSRRCGRRRTHGGTGGRGRRCRGGSRSGDRHGRRRCFLVLFMIPGISKPQEDEIKTDQHRGDGGQHENDLQSAVFPAVIIIIIVRVIGIPVFPGKQSHQALSRFFVFLKVPRSILHLPHSAHDPLPGSDDRRPNSIRHPAGSGDRTIYNTSMYLISEGVFS